MKKLICILLVTVFILCGCAPSGRGRLNCLSRPASAEIIVTRGETVFRGQLTLGASDTGLPRDALLVCSSPESLAGLRAERKNGVSTVTLGNIVLPSDASASAFLHAAWLFSPEGSMVSSKLCELNGKKVTRICVTSESATRTIYISPDDAPVRIESDGIEVDIVWYEFISP